MSKGLNGGLGVFLVYFRVFGVSRKFQGCFKEVSRVFQGSFKDVSSKFQGWFQRVSKEFPCCFSDEFSRKV